MLGYGEKYEDLAGFLKSLGSNAPHERAMQSVAPRAAAPSSEAERHYREVALRAWNRTVWADLPVDRHLAARDLELCRLYVALQVEVEVPAGAELAEAQLLALEQRRSGRRLAVWQAATSPQRDGTRRVSIGQRLGAARRLVVLGDPGAGKTTLLR